MIYWGLFTILSLLQKNNLDKDMMKGRKDDIVIKDPLGFLRPQNVSSTRTAQKQYPQPTPSRNTSFETGEM